MIIKEFFRIREDGVKLCRLYSDLGVYIKKVGTSEIYEEVFDIENAPFKYIETYNKIKDKEDIVTPEDDIIIDDGDKELTSDEIATMLEEVF